LLHAFGGNFLAGRYYCSMTVAGATFTTPGVPFSVLFGVEPAALRSRALCLGPFNPPAGKEIESFLAGNAKWVPEAAGVPIGLAQGGETRTLASREGFRADFTLPL
ncbi:MAG: hypothetical protein K8I02_07375, partial [Candidatus Methylomirabilis sp.]|nr:hypothetical protein [Deltaproteobacteria bacterium]